MSEPQTHNDSGKPARSRWKYVLYPILGLVGLLIFALIITQTGFFKSWLKDKIVSIANDSLQARLEIDDLSGSLFTNLQLNDTRLLLEGDTLLTVASISAEYSPLDLLGGRLTVESLLIDSVHLYLREDSATGWNMTRITQPDTTAIPGTTGDEPLHLPFEIDLQQLTLTNSTADIRSGVRLIPRRIIELHLGLSAFLVNDSQTVTLDSLHFQTQEPDVHLKQLGLRVYRDADAVQLSDFVVVTEQNRLHARGAYREPSGKQSTASATTEPLYTEEFSFVLPTVDIGVSPRLSFAGELLRDTLAIDLKLDTDTSSIQLTGRAINLLSTGDATNGDITYQLRVLFDNVAAAEWLADTSLNYHVNGSIDVDGRGIDPDSLSAGVVASLYNSTVYERGLDTAGITLTYRDGNATIDALLSSAFGAATITGAVDDIMSERRYDLEFTMHNVDLATPFNDSTLVSNLTGGGRLSGQLDTFPPERSQFSLYLNRSNIYATDIDSLDVAGQVSDGRLRLDTLLLHSSAIKLAARGDYEFDGALSVDYGIEVIDPSALADLIGADSLVVHGTVNGSASGSIDSLATMAQLNVDSLQYNTYYVGGLNGTAHAQFANDQLTYSTDLAATSVLAAGFDVETIDATIAFDNERYTFNVAARRGEELSAGVAGKVRLDSTIVASLTGLRVQHKDNTWYATDTAMLIEITDSDIRIDGLRLTSEPEQADTTQLIDIEGLYSFEDSSSLSVNMQNIHLTTIAALMDSTAMFGGNLSAEIQLNGRTESPRIDGSFAVRDGSFNKYNFRLFEGNIDFHDVRLDADAILQTTSNDSLTLLASLPVDLMAADGDYLRYHDSVHIDILWDRLPLTVLSASGDQFEDVSGFIDGNLRIYNTLAAPRTAGSISIVDGAISMPRHGIDYREFRAGIRFDSTRMEIDSIIARTEEGYALIDGFLNFDSTLLAGQFRERRLQLTADDFFALRHAHYEVKITGDAVAEGSAQDSRFSGDITVNRANLWLPALTGGTEAAESQGVPMLVRAVGDTIRPSDTSAQDAPTAAAADTLFKWYENLSGSITLNMPRNTWLRSPDMRIEIQGRIDAVKQQEAFELFGTISVVRGYYELFGKRFVFDEGEFTFDGGDEVNPRIDLTAHYNFRTPERERKQLKLHATGRAFAPEIQFSLDGMEITQGDAAAYIVFGRSLDQLTQGQRRQVAASSGPSEAEVAGRLAANLLADQLAQALGASFNLDVIEIKAQESLEGAAVVVGKYIADRLFVSYQRGIGVGRDEELAPEIVTIEWEWTDWLIIRGIEGDPQESGFDIILKFHE